MESVFFKPRTEFDQAVKKRTITSFLMKMQMMDPF